MENDKMYSCKKFRCQYCNYLCRRMDSLVHHKKLKHAKKYYANANDNVKQNENMDETIHRQSYISVVFGSLHKGIKTCVDCGTLFNNPKRSHCCGDCLDKRINGIGEENIIVSVNGACRTKF